MEKTTGSATLISSAPDNKDRPKANQNQNAVHKDGIRGRCGFPKVQVQFLPNYLRRDATALGLRLLSMLDITSSFHKDSDEM